MSVQYGRMGVLLTGNAEKVERNDAGWVNFVESLHITSTAEVPLLGVK